jgi:hypothetical protein
MGHCSRLLSSGCDVMHFSTYAQMIRKNRLLVISVTWLIILVAEGAKSAMGILVKSRDQFRKTGKIGLYQSLIHIHLLPHCHPKFLYLSFFKSVAEKY